MATTTSAWWTRTRDDPELLLEWLFDQYRGEATAAGRIRELRDTYAKNAVAFRLLSHIASQEEKHAAWVGSLLAARGVVAAVDDAKERYWQAPLAAIHDLETGCAVGAHAEAMRLERIRTIAADPKAPDDVRAVFTRILREEVFHERAFRTLAGPDAMAETRNAHELGRTALGLVP